MTSACSVLVALLLLSELNGRPVAAGSSADVEVGVIDRDGVGLIPSDEPVADEPALVAPPVLRRSLAWGEDRTPKVFIIPDVRLRGRGARGLSPAFTRSLPAPPADQSPSHVTHQRDTDLDMLRCMIGRVYRPCWEV